MNFNAYNEYLSGTKVNTGLKLKITSPLDQHLVRLHLLGALVTGKSVLHFGCTGHLEKIDCKISRSEWLHGIITQRSEYCLGVDINEQAIDYLAQKYGYTNIINFNVLLDDVPPEIHNKKWDYIILGELLEHTDNPVYFLQTLSQKLHPFADSIIITVPNAFQYLNLKKVFQNTEIVNSDHRYWFSPYTLNKTVVQAGITPLETYMCEYHPIVEKKKHPAFQFKKLIKRSFLKKFPLARQCIVVKATLS